MEVNMLLESIKFMFLGMGVVFLFLTFMIYVLKLQSYLIWKFFPEEDVVVKHKVESKSSENTNSQDSANKIAAVIGAIQHHKNKEI
jgi:oxaloacetate decarboxylase gamma subunit